MVDDPNTPWNEDREARMEHWFEVYGKKILTLIVIVATACREAGVIPSPWDKVVGSTIAGLFAWGFLRPPTPPTPKT